MLLHGFGWDWVGLRGPRRRPGAQAERAGSADPLEIADDSQWRIDAAPFSFCLVTGQPVQGSGAQWNSKPYMDAPCAKLSIHDGSKVKIAPVHSDFGVALGHCP